MNSWAGIDLADAANFPKALPDILCLTLASLNQSIWKEHVCFLRLFEWKVVLFDAWAPS